MKPLAVVSGATSGFGLAAAEHLARQGFDLRLVVRDAGRGRAVANRFGGIAGGQAEVVVADLSSIAETDRAGLTIAAPERPINVLLNNAGAVFGLRRRVSIDDIELTMALNHFGYVALTRRLMPLVEQAGGRVVCVASDAYEYAGGRFDFDRWNAERGYRPQRQYGRSKLANILFAAELARRAPAVEAVAWSPAGLTATKFGYGANVFAPLFMKLTHPFAQSIDEAAQPLLNLCTSPLQADQHGAFVHGSDVRPVDVAPTNDAIRLWEMTERIIEDRLELARQA